MRWTYRCQGQDSGPSFLTVRASDAVFTSSIALTVCAGTITDECFMQQDHPCGVALSDAQSPSENTISVVHALLRICSFRSNVPLRYLSRETFESDEVCFDGFARDLARRFVAKAMAGLCSARNWLLPATRLSLRLLRARTRVTTGLALKIPSSSIMLTAYRKVGNSQMTPCDASIWHLWTSVQHWQRSRE